MRFLSVTICIALCAALPAHAINKCKASDGRFVYQDRPCLTGQGGEIEVRPASGHAAPAPPPAPAVAGAAPPAQPQTEAQRLQLLSQKLRKSNRLDSLNVRIVPDAQGAVDFQKARCDKSIAALQLKKQSASNNLAGATWEGSISAEMSALAARCDTEARATTRNLDTLLKEQSDLRAELGKN